MPRSDGRGRRGRFSGRPSQLLSAVADELGARLTWADRIGSYLDNAVALFSPERGRRRAVVRARMFAASVAWRAATRDRQQADWNPRIGSTDSLLADELPTIRARARDLERNDPHCRSLIEAKCDNVVGTGMRPQSRADADELGLTEDQVQEWNGACDAAFNTWADRQADAAGLSSFWDLQRLAYRGQMIDGEFAVHTTTVPVDPENGRSLPVALELVAPERIATPTGEASRALPQELMQRIRSGIETGRYGQPLAYWIADANPDERSLAQTITWERVRRWRAGRLNLLHVFRRDAADQSRGVPALAPCMAEFRHLNKYLEAEVIAARVSACIALFVKRTGLEDMPANFVQENDGTDTRILQRMEPGIIEYLEPGEEIQQVVPQRPGVTFEPFVRRMLTAAAAAGGIPVQLMLRDWSQANYSSARVDLLEARRGFRCDQQRLVWGFCAPVRELVLWTAYLAGELPTMPAALVRNYWQLLMRASWVPNAYGWVDPTKEIEASAAAIAGGLSTLAAEASQAGESWEDVLEQRARELRRISEIEAKHGLPAGSLAPQRSASAPAATPTPQQGNQ